MKDKVPAELPQPPRHRHRACAPTGVPRHCSASARWQELAERGAHPQRLLWASTGTKDPGAPDTLYVEALAAPDTINTIPEKTLHAFAEHGKVGAAMPVDGGDAEAVIARIRARQASTTMRSPRGCSATVPGLREVVEGTDVAHREKRAATRGRST